MDFDTLGFPDAVLDDMLAAPKCTILSYYSLCIDTAVLHYKALLSIVEPRCCKVRTNGFMELSPRYQNLWWIESLHAVRG